MSKTYSGIRIEGDGRGKDLGFPTLNILLDTDAEFKLHGVFVVSVFMMQKEYFGLVHLGPRPTFSSTEFRIEIFLFSFHSHTDVGTKVEFTVLQKIREIQEFSSPKKLVAQIKRDEIMGKAYVEKYIRERKSTDD